MSSANKRTCYDSFSDRSFMYTRNRIGLKIEPWGTPEVTVTYPKSVHAYGISEQERRNEKN